ncbi:acyl-CoA reductase [Mucilaginibacter sp. KACC 22063]|uniref:acyl-CoA reductase n=1 Tax=Mucilaginibacter sp. KACC 22063 TaxID=3025666 RepID=UPI0023655987|nr:acyl-CoA reductase [Mucilaginibacter sp. KACC 22063]WDF57016.1 acyl-CoA reductase [Mucilaginibacter sp. KACC 22063]
MVITDKNYIINVIATLGKQLSAPDETLSAIINNERYHNAWFTPESVMSAVKATGQMLNEADITAWVNRYPVNNHQPKRIGLILAGNIPMVGFHDILCVLITGHIALIKLSSQDSRLIRHVLQMLIELAPELKERIVYTERLDNFDAVIATGSNNTSRYFDYYFGKVPNIIRKNRNSVSVLSGFETKEQLQQLGHDIFDYFGLGCRNVSHLLVPKDYNFIPFFEAIEEFNPIADHHKYHNNYDYNKAIFLVNRNEHLDNGFLLLKEDERLASPLAVVYYSFYDTYEDAVNKLNDQQDNIQCIVSKMELNTGNQVVEFGQSQYPKLWDYADGVDTMAFLTEL